MGNARSVCEPPSRPAYYVMGISTPDLPTPAAGACDALIVGRAGAGADHSEGGATALATALTRVDQAETLLRGLSETIPGFIWAADAQGGLDYSTQAWVDFAGGQPNETRGNGWANFVHADDLPRALAAWHAALESGTPYDVRFRVRRRDGVYRWFLVRATPLRDGAGTIVRWAGINVDVHDQVQAELALQELNANLEARVAQATAERELIEATLRQSLKMEAIGQLTGGIAHDFNNMLQGVIGSLDLIRRRIEQGRTAEIGRLVGLATQGADRAAALTAQLLSFARRQALTPRPADPATVVRTMAELVRRTVGPAVTVTLGLQEGLSIVCDVNGLENAILNLAINARDAMPGGGTLSLAVTGVMLDTADTAGHDGVEPGPFVRLTVEDTGVGMTAEVAVRAFEPFYTTKPVGLGTGLGLSQIYGFVSQSGGIVDLRTALGAGTTVSLLLPWRTSVAIPQSCQPDTIVLVEDDEDVRTMAAEALTEAGWTVEVAGDSVTALALMQVQEPALLVTDVGLPPGLNGRQLAEAARDRWPQLKVLFITGHAEQVQTAGQLDPGIGVISKPFTLSTLVSRVSAMATPAAPG